MAPCSSKLVIKDIADLPDYEILQLMERLPLIELVHLGCVNRRFYDLSRKCYPARKDPVLVIGDPQVVAAAKLDCMFFNGIHLSMLTDHNVKCLQSLLPAITKLRIIIINSNREQIALLIDLLCGLSTQLVGLSLGFDYGIDSSSTLFDALNSLSKLITLDLACKSRFINNNNEAAAAFNLPIISQLETLFFSSPDNGDLILAEIVKRASTNDKLTKVKLSNRLCEHSSLELLLNLKPQLASAFKELALIDPILTSRQLMAFCSKFTNLTKLTISLFHLTIRQVNRALMLLPKLEHLELDVLFTDRTTFRNKFMNLSEEAREVANANVILISNDIEPDTTDASTLVPLKSVTKLNLQSELARHDDLMLLHLAVLLPNVDTLNFNIIKCEQCGHDLKNFNLEGRRRCLQKTAVHWRMLPKLRKVTLIEYIELSEEEWQTSPSSTAND